MDICKVFYWKLVVDGIVFSEEIFCLFKVIYYWIVLDFIVIYYNDVCMNGLYVDCYVEEIVVELFVFNIM